MLRHSLLAFTFGSRAGMLCCRYWTQEPREDKLEALIVAVGLQDALRYHTGSVALCSLFFAAVNPLQVSKLDHAGSPV